MNDTTLGQFIRTGLQILQDAGTELLELMAQLVDKAAATPMQYAVIGAVVLYCSVLMIHFLDKAKAKTQEASGDRTRPKN